MAEPDSQSVSVIFYIGYTRTLLEELIEDILGTLEFYESDRCGADGLGGPWLNQVYRIVG